MTIKFDITEDDYMAFAEHFQKKSPLVKRQWRRFTLIATIAMFCVSFALGVRHSIAGAVLTGLFSALLMYLWALIARQITPRLNRALYKSAAQDVIGEVELEVTPQGLRSKSRRGEASYFWDSIGDINTTPTHTFIYIGKMQGIIIPQRRMLSGNYPAFMQALADIYANRRDAALSTPPLATPTLPVTPPVEQQVVQRIEQGPR